MVKSIESPGAALPRAEVVKLLSDTAHAVKVMKASWLRVALNLKKIRKHELWRLTSPPCASYEDYAYGVLKLNRGVERRMLQAVDYTEERRPGLIESFQEREGDLEIPSYETVNQLRRAEDLFRDRPEEWKSLETLVFDEGAGRIALKREIDERLGSEGATSSGDEPGPGSAPASPPLEGLAAVVHELREIEDRLRTLRVSPLALKRCGELIATLEREANSRLPPRAGAAGAMPQQPGQRGQAKQAELPEQTARSAKPERPAKPDDGAAPPW